MGVHASPSRLRRELSEASPMPSPVKTRDISDFFRPYARHKTESTVPQKRPSPSPDHEATITIDTGTSCPTYATTPSIKRIKDAPRSPLSPTVSPLSAPRSGASLSIPIRSPRPKPSPRPASVYKRGPLFETQSKAETPLKKPETSISFADLPKSTQSVVKDGRVIAVRDSDEEEDDDTSLESLTDMFGKRQDVNKSSDSSPPVIDEAPIEKQRVNLLSLFTRGRSDPLIGKDNLRTIYAKERANRFDISGLLTDHFDDQEVVDNVQKAEAQYEASKAEVELRGQVELDRDLLASIVQTEDGDEDGLARLLNAVERTEALSIDKSFSFFRQNGLTDWHDEEPFECDLEDSAIPDQIWRPGDNDARHRAFLTGYIGDLAASGKLSDNALNWTFESVVVEQADDLRQAYINVLRAGSPVWTRTNVTAMEVQTVFQTLGAEPDNIRDGSPIEPRQQASKSQRMPDAKYLLAVLDLFQAICNDMDFMALSKLVSIICRLALDAELMSHARITSTVEDTLEALLSLRDVESRSHVAERILTDLGQNLHDATLQAQILSHILPTSKMACNLRISLAQVFLLGSSTMDPKKLQSPTISLKTLTNHISTSSLFDTTRRTVTTGSQPLNYKTLKSLTYTLDTAIADGFPPSSSSTTNPQTSRTEISQFNKSVDRLADRIRAIFVSIADTGASHMRRTEAKDLLQALHWRLLYAVRTEPRPKKHVFDTYTGKSVDGDTAREGERGRDFMKSFLDRRKQIKQELKTEEDVRMEEEEDSKMGEEVVSRDGTPAVALTTLPSSETSQSQPPSETELMIRRQLNLQPISPRHGSGD